MGGVEAFAELTGEEWKVFETRSGDRFEKKAAEAQLADFRPLTPKGCRSEGFGPSLLPVAVYLWLWASILAFTALQNA